MLARIMDLFAPPGRAAPLVLRHAQNRFRGASRLQVQRCIQNRSVTSIVTCRSVTSIVTCTSLFYWFSQHHSDSICPKHAQTKFRGAFARSVKGFQKHHSLRFAPPLTYLY